MEPENTRRGDVGEWRIGRNPRCTGPATPIAAQGGADEHAGSAITALCDAAVDLAAEAEVGGVACRSYQHTLAMLLALECHLAGDGTDALATSVALAADASAFLYSTANPIGGLRFPILCSVRRAFTSRRPRTGCVRHSRARSCCARARGCPRWRAKRATKATSTST